MSNAYGQAYPPDSYGEFNELTFMIRRMLAEISTMIPVQVISCTNTGLLAAVGTVTVQPLVTYLDGDGTAYEHGYLLNLPYFRLQGGANAVIIDPTPGDIGFAIFAHQDISSFTQNKGMANPGSLRKFSMSDGIFVGGILNQTPTQYVRMSATGITISDANGNQIVMSAGSVNVITPSFEVNGIPITIP